MCANSHLKSDAAPLLGLDFSMGLWAAKRRPDWATARGGKKAQSLRNPIVTPS
jgi:hypothetical protein